MLKFLAAELGLDQSCLSEAMVKTQVPRHKAGNEEEIALGWIVDKHSGIHRHNGETSGYCSWISEDTFWGTYGNTGVHSYPVVAVVKPSQMILLGDSRWPGPGISSRMLGWDYAWMGFWHTRRCNYAFWDGHAEALRALMTVTDNESDCMWGHDIWPHSVHLTARDNARPEYR